jgi:cytochrome c peroxidase
MLCGLLMACSACSDKPPVKITVSLPYELPQPEIPPNNLLTKEKIRLGRYLFYDKKLSGNGSMSCASCHQPDLSFTDGEQVAVGSTGVLHSRNTPTLVNVAYMRPLTWSSPLIQELEQQILIPLFSDTPVEMGVTGHEQIILKALRAQQPYPDLFEAAFPQQKDAFGFNNIVLAIASFVRSIVSFNSDFDLYAYGAQDSALSDSQLRGLDLFMSEKLECHHCHGGINFSQSSTHALNNSSDKPFHNTGLYNLHNKGDYPRIDRGLFDISGLPEDMGKFKAPSLRNVALTAPYMHDGSVESLREVLEIYSAGGRNVQHGVYVGDGRANPYKSIFVRPLMLSESEIEDLLQFLHALTDKSTLKDESLSDPWLNAAVQ